MYRKVPLALLLLFLLLLTLATLDTFWFHQFHKNSDATDENQQSPEVQLNLIQQQHPLLAIYALTKKEPSAALAQLEQWRRQRKTIETIEHVYILWIQRRAAQIVQDEVKLSDTQQSLQMLADKNQLHWLSAWLIQEQAKQAIQVGNLQQALTMIEQSVELAEKDNAEFLLLEIYNTAGVAYNSTNSLTNALRYFLKGIKLAEKYPKSQFNALFNNNLGLLYVHLEQWQNALVYLNRAEQQYEDFAEHKPDYMLLIILNQSFAHVHLGHIDKARDKLEQAQRLVNPKTSDFYKAVLLKNEARLLLAEDSIEQAIDKAEGCLNLMLESQFPKQHAICALVQGQAYFKNNMLEEAYSLTNNAIEVFTKLNHQRWLIKSQLFLSLVLESLGQSKAALAELKTVHAQEKSMLIGELAALNNAFEIQQIAQERDLLIAKNKLSELKQMIDKQRLRLLVLWLSIAAIILVWLGYKAKRMSNDNRLLYDLSYSDPLTGAANRHLYQKEIKSPSILDDSATYRLVIIDLDHFKQINDSYGHDKGDVVLSIAAMRLSRFIQSQELFVRWGGEEFLMVLKSRGNFKEFVEGMAESLRCEPFKIGDNTLYVTASFGVSEELIIESLNGSDAAFKVADECLYRAKQQGRDRVVMAEHEVSF
ncbi:diguanylate cyclase [Pseudoalteromonas piscicida]|uniref:diguanylate cyclase n=1 Tax=Pseudoalteromonas piscicida TaxID=43662 RepID=A0ABM6NLK2_PSEO7|nr:diguanylate cyclase [Pseudoalteromonas piscicida]ATD09709.1 hypothetical protein PPIS_b0576 [Pseudoalteromonas piscicida]WPU31614.1 diguanylate cyclase [Pseudoalteromonas piscicida]